MNEPIMRYTMSINDQHHADYESWEMVQMAVQGAMSIYNLWQIDYHRGGWRDMEVEPGTESVAIFFVHPFDGREMKLEAKPM